MSPTEQSAYESALTSAQVEISRHEETIRERSEEVVRLTVELAEAEARATRLGVALRKYATTSPRGSRVYSCQSCGAMWGYFNGADHAEEHEPDCEIAAALAPTPGPTAQPPCANEEDCDHEPSCFEAAPSQPGPEERPRPVNERPPQFDLVEVWNDGAGTVSMGAGFTTVRACRHCGVLIAGGPNACLQCAKTAAPSPGDVKTPEAEQRGWVANAEQWLRKEGFPPPEPTQPTCGGRCGTDGPCARCMAELQEKAAAPAVPPRTVDYKDALLGAARDTVAAKDAEIATLKAQLQHAGEENVAEHLRRTKEIAALKAERDQYRAEHHKIAHHHDEARAKTEADLAWTKGAVSLAEERATKAEADRDRKVKALERLTIDARRVRDVYPDAARGTYYADLCASLKAAEAALSTPPQQTEKEGGK